MKKKKLILILILILTTAISGIFIGRLSIGSVSAEGEGYENLKVFTEVLSIVKRSYVEEVKTKDLIYGAIKGMLSSLDPHSGFMPPEMYKELQVETRGEFGGLGIQIGIKEGVLTVIAPIEDTPAYKAGILAGDKIIKINGEITKDMGINDAVSKMRGPKGTSVVITIIREGWKEAKDFTIVRDVIKVKSVKSKIIEEKMGYVKVNQFQERTASDLDAALSKLAQEGITSLILDVRNNPGGLLSSAVEVSGQFLPPGNSCAPPSTTTCATIRLQFPNSFGTTPSSFSRMVRTAASVASPPSGNTLSNGKRSIAQANKAWSHLKRCCAGPANGRGCSILSRTLSSTKRSRVDRANSSRATTNITA